MKRFDTRSLRRASALFGVVVLALSTGCVTRGTHDEVVRERDGLRSEKRRLEAKVERLGASNESLGAERVKLIDEMEDLRQTRNKLQVDVRKLVRSEARLAKNLEVTQAELETRARELDDLQGTYQGLVNDLESEVAAGQIEIEQLREGVRLNLHEDVLFPSGSATLNSGGRGVLAKVSGRLAGLPHRIEVQGHTDDVPIKGGATARFPSNWELAAARATEVVRLLASQGVSPQRLTAVSFGEFAPVASNDTREGRARNRRIEIRLHPMDEVVPAAQTGDPPAPGP